MNFKYHNDIILTDRCILEYKEIFVKNMKETNLMTFEDYERYE